MLDLKCIFPADPCDLLSPNKPFVSDLIRLLTSAMHTGMIIMGKPKRKEVISAAKEESLIHVQYKGKDLRVVVPTQGMFVDKVKELIVEELKALRELQSVKDDIFPDDITLFTDAERTKEITSDEMSCLIKLGANVQR